MFIIGEAVIDDDVKQASFCCDLDQCKGACCTLEGGRGAPLENNEVLEIHKAYPLVKKYLDERSIKIIEQDGPVDGSADDPATRCIEGRDCVFVHYDNGIAKCSFETAFLNGESDWRKPISCHLFPIRIRHFGKDVIRYEQINVCEAGRTRGRIHEVKLYDFLREPLIRKYGQSWYEQFKHYCQTQSETSQERSKRNE